MDTHFPNDARHQLGGNNPPAPEAIDFALMLDPAILRDQFELDHADRVSRRNALVESATRFIADHATIDSKEIYDRATDVVKQWKSFMDDAELQRKSVGRPFRDATGAVQAFFDVFLQGALDSARVKVQARMDDFARRETARLRREAVEEAAKKQAVADAAAAEAEKTMRPAALEHAQHVEKEAAAAQRKATTKPAGLLRGRGDHGGVAAFYERWDFEVKNLADVPPEYLTSVVDVAKVREAIKAGAREITGLEIFDASTVRVK